MCMEVRRFVDELFQSMHPAHTHLRTRRTNTNSISRHFSSVDRFVFKSKHFHLCLLANGHGRVMRASAEHSKIRFSVVRLVMQCVCVCVRAGSGNEQTTQMMYSYSIISISNVESSQKYVSLASLSCLPLSQHITKHTHTHMHTPSSGQQTISCLDGT